MDEPPDFAFDLDRSTAQAWDQFAERYGELDLCRFLDAKPRDLLDAMMARGLNSPLASSCGRLFDAVAAAHGGDVGAGIAHPDPHRHGAPGVDLGEREQRGARRGGRAGRRTAFCACAWRNA